MLINTIFSWCSTWQLSINISKSYILHLGSFNNNFIYHISGTILSCPPSISDLGVIVDPQLTFHQHIAKISLKARSRCILYLKSFISRDPKIMLKFFTTYVRPILEYGSPVWTPINTADIAKLENVQRFFTNKIPGCTFLPYHLRLSKLSLSSLRHRRQVADLMFLNSIISGSSSASLSPYLIHIPPSVTRGHNLKIFAPTLRYQRSCQNIISRSVLIWNNLPLSALGSTSSSLRNFLTQHLPDPYLIR